MKKFLAIILALIVAFLAIYYFFFAEKDVSINSNLAASIEENPSMYPLYSRLSRQEKDAYLKICSAAQNFDDQAARIYTGTSQRDVENFIAKLQSNLHSEIAYEHPEIFWFDPYNFGYTIVSMGDEYYLNLTLSYLFDKDEVARMQPRFEKQIEKIVTAAQAKESTYEQVLYVHDYIVGNCEYDDACYETANFKSPSINAYGCLVDGKAICSGYTMAFNTIMKRLGYEIGVEFNTYNGLSIFAEGHVWNYCKLDGEYYYFDLTWDDTDSDSEIYSLQPYSHSYFAITTDELEDAHLTLAPEAPTPDCNGTKYNYFIYNNLNFSEYDFETVKPVILSQSAQKCIQLRFDSYSALLSAQSDLITDGKIFSLFPDAKSCQHYTSKSGLQLYIFMQ